MLLLYRQLKRQYSEAVETPRPAQSDSLLDGRAQSTREGSDVRLTRPNELLKLLLCEAIESLNRLKGKVQTATETEDGSPVRIHPQLRACTVVESGDKVVFNEMKSLLDRLQEALASLLQEF